MSSRLKRALLLVCFSVLILMVILQLYLYHRFAYETISCGGDWSYMNKCPLGSMCFYKKGSANPLAGGTCRPYVWALFGGKEKIK